MIPFRDRNRSSTFPIVTVLLIAANVLAFIYTLRLGPKAAQEMVMTLGVIPARAALARHGHADQGAIFGLSMLTSMFLHGGWLHIIGNMWYLWIFGDNVEDRLGHAKYFFFYLACGVIAALAHTWANPESRMPTVGASGAVAGVLGAYLVSFPRARILTLVPILFFFYVIELPAVFLLGFWFLLQVISQSFTPAHMAGVAFMAHVGGFVAGMVLALVIPCRRGFRPTVAVA